MFKNPLRSASVSEGNNHLEERLATTLVALTVLALGAASAFAAGDSRRVTFSRDVAPIFFQNCVSCHRAGQAAPMSLLTYEEARPWAKSIKKNVGDKIMPPWHADPGFGPFTNERTLTDEEIATVVKWVDTGAPRGNPEHLPVAPDFPDSGWQLGEPDYIIEFDEFEVPGSGPDQFYDVRHKTDFPEDRWISAIEFLPGDNQVVHHVILWQGAPGANEQGWLAAWAAGATPVVFPEGTGRLLKKGATIVGDFHYHPIEETRTDRTRVGIHFAENNRVEKELINLWVMNASFEIPAGDPNVEAKSSFTFKQDSHILGLAPHMHYRGKDFKYTATYPDGRTEELLSVSKYDFNWQTVYEFVEPVAMPEGTRIDCVAHWDNSAENESNPDATKTVHFGPESTDEMMIGFVDYIVDEGLRPKPPEDADLVMREKVVELVAMFPGDIYTVKVPVAPGQPARLSALHIPHEGDGGWYVPIGNIAGKAPIAEIAWDGNAFTAVATIPGQGATDLKGRFNEETGALSITMSVGGQSGGFPLVAKRVE